MDQILGSLSESRAVTSRQSLTKPDVHTLPCLDTETHCGPVLVCFPDEIQAFSLPASRGSCFMNIVCFARACCFYFS